MVDSVFRRDVYGNGKVKFGGAKKQGEQVKGDKPGEGEKLGY
jgi:hypothetical protein